MPLAAFTLALRCHSLSKGGANSWRNGRTIWIVDAHRSASPPSFRFRRAGRHRAQELEHQIRGQHRGNLSGPVVARRHFDDIAADERQRAEAAHEPLRFVARQAADLRRPRPWRERRINAVDVEGYICRTGCNAADLGHDPRDAAVLHLLDIDHRDPVLAMEIEIVLAEHRPPNADLDEPSSVDEAFLDRATERRAVKILAAKVLVPRVDVRVELHQSHRPAALCKSTQHGERDRVIPADDDWTSAGVGNVADAA